MAKLEQIASDAGESLETLIPRVIRETGSVHKAAIVLGVYPNAIRHWLDKNKLRLVIRRTVDVEKDL